MPVDWNRALERAKELQDRGYSSSQIDAVLNEEAAAADRAAQQYGHQSASAARSTLQSQRGALNADAAGPGEVPDVDPIARGFAQAVESGHARGSDQRMDAYLQGVFQAAQAGDPRVVTTGVVDDDTKRRWMDDAHRRQIANRDASGAGHR